jgi:succinyl-diaminopimelate desuccinylase
MGEGAFSLREGIESSPNAVMDKATLLSLVDQDRERLTAFVSEFVRRASPNPPGDTRSCAELICGLLAENGLAYNIISPHAHMPNIVATFEGAHQGRHLNLNGHMDVFPVADPALWSFDPWSGAVVNGSIRGRGAADMKAGTAASVFAFIYLSRIVNQLHGRLTLMVVSDEETFGPWGARYLADHHPEFFGTCCLNGEPSGPSTVRFGEKGLLWLRFSARTKGAHGAYQHLSKSAVKLACSFITRLEALTEITPPDLGEIETLVRAARPIIDNEFGRGACDVVRRVTVNPGIIQGGTKVNLIASQASVDVDIRIPNGLTDADLLAPIDRLIAAEFPEIGYEVLVYNPPAVTAPDDEMIAHVRNNAKLVSGIDPTPIISLGGTDARLWRYRGIPAVIYGAAPKGIGGVDEHVEVDDLIHVVKCHVASAFDYLTKSDRSECI